MSGTKGLLDRGGVKAVWRGEGGVAGGSWLLAWLCHSLCSRKEIMQTLWSTLEQSPPPVKNQTKLGALPSWRPGVQSQGVTGHTPSEGSRGEPYPSPCSRWRQCGCTKDEFPPTFQVTLIVLVKLT